MMITHIHPSHPEGRFIPPPSKAMYHRFLISAALAENRCHITCPGPICDDVRATVSCLEKLGAICREDASGISVQGIGGRFFSSSFLPAGESGSTLRFLIPLCLLTGHEHTFSLGSGLMKRPLSVYEDLCKNKGLLFRINDNNLTVCGPVRSGVFRFPGNISSQFVSGLLFALPLLQDDSTIILLPPVESRPYIGMTLQVLSQYGIRAEWENECTLHIPGKQQYHAADQAVPPDADALAIAEAINLLGGNLSVPALFENDLQPDRIYPRFFAALKEGKARIDLADQPDLGPILFSLAGALHGAFFTGFSRLRLKESDRVLSMTEELAKFGIRSRISPEVIEILPSRLQAPSVPLSCHGDHRVALALACLCTKTGGSLVGSECVSKSWPGFFEQMRDLKLQYETLPCL